MKLVFGARTYIRVGVRKLKVLRSSRIRIQMKQGRLCNDDGSLFQSGTRNDTAPAKVSLPATGFKAVFTARSKCNRKSIMGG